MSPMVVSPPTERRLLTLELTAMGRLGEAMAELDGKPVYVFGGIPGETVIAEVLRERRGYVAAQAVEILSPSPHRVTPPCGYFGRCTGCQWQHIAYEHQLELKRGVVTDALSRIAGLDGSVVAATVPSPEQLGYRNHARFTVSRGRTPARPSTRSGRAGPEESAHDGDKPERHAQDLAATASADDRDRGVGAEPALSLSKGQRPAAGEGDEGDALGRLGYVHRELRRHVDIDECLLMAPWINQALAALQGHAAETTQLSLRYGINTESWMLQPTLQNMDVPMASGQKHYTESLLGHTFRVSSPSFFQVNTHQAERVAQMVIDALALTGRETVVDAYAGVGTFAVLVADRARRVVAVEESASAVADARVNVEGIDNVELRHARTEDVLLELAADGIDAVVLDPPRAGCMPGTLDALVAAPPKRIAYVSCDPETLARDLAVLTAGPFKLESVQPIDMFPQTHHVECLATLVLDEERRDRLAARQHLVLASASPRRSEILARLGLTFDVDPTDVEEPPGQSGDATQLALARARAKAQAAAAGRDSGTVVGADTVVELDGAVLGKPTDAQQAVEMLHALRGREHRVVTAVALVDAATGELVDGYRASRVVMRDYTEEELDAYVASRDPLDKAGAYGVQSEDFAPAAEVRGCYLNVVGLPVCTLLKLAERFGVRLGPAPELPWPELDRCPECARRVSPRSARSKKR